MQDWSNQPSARDRLGWGAVAYSFSGTMAGPNVMLVVESDRKSPGEPSLVRRSLENGPVPVVMGNGSVDAAFISAKFLERLTDLVTRALGQGRSSGLAASGHIEYIQALASELNECNRHLKEQQQKIEKSTRKVLSAGEVTDRDLDLIDRMPIHPASKGIDEEFR